MVTWQSKKQPVVARSNGDAEFRAMCHGICEGIWLRRMLRELAAPITGPMILLCHNKAAIEIAKNLVHHDRTKYVEIDHHFIKEKIEDGIIKLTYILTSHQTTDILTKALPRNNFDSLKSKLGMIDIHNPA